MTQSTTCLHAVGDQTMEAWPEEGPLANRGELSTSCLPCFKRHIKCERRIPCLR